MIKINVGKNLIADICALYIIIWSFFPALSSGTVYRAILIFAAMIIIFNAINTSICQKHLLYGLLLSLLYFGFNYFTEGLSYSIGHTINLFIYILVGIIAEYYFENDIDKIIGFIVVILFAIIIVQIQSINTVITNPSALRMATRIATEDTASYSFVYMNAQMVPLLLYAFKNRLFNAYKFCSLLSMISMILGAILVALSGFLLANVLMLLGLFCNIVFSMQTTSKKIMLSIVFALALIFIVPLLKWIFDFLMNLTMENPFYYNKIVGIYNQLFNEAGVSSAYDRRAGLYALSYSSLFKYPILGSILLTGQKIVGGHTTLVDYFAAYGWGVGILYYCQVIRPAFRLVDTFDTRKILNKTLIIVILICGLFNTYSYAFTWVWYVLAPYLAYLESSFNKNINIEESKI